MSAPGARGDKVTLVGQMGTGKTTVARLLAARRGVAWVDLDHAIEARGRTIPEIFASDGEAAFRALEAEVRDAIYARPGPLVVATGGGAPCSAGAVEVMRAAGPVVWLELSPAAIVMRLAASPRALASRPLLAHLDHDAAVAFLAEQLAARRPFYAQADLTLDASAAPDVVAAAIDRALPNLLDLPG